MTIELSGGSRTVEVLVALLVLGAVAFVATRAAMAQRRGEHAGAAAASAFKAVGPPVALAVFGLLFLSVMAGLFGLIVILVLVSAVNGDIELTGSVVLLFFGGLLALLVTVVGAFAWGVVRILRYVRARQ